MKNINFLLSNYKVASAINTPEIEFESGATVAFDVMIESVVGTPTTASLAAKFQVAPIEYNGYNMNTDSVSGVARPWIDVVAADGFMGQNLLDGAWPTALADHTLAAHRIVTRRLIVPVISRLVRLVLTPTFSGGTSPGFRVTVAAACDE